MSASRDAHISQCNRRQPDCFARGAPIALCAGGLRPFEVIGRESTAFPVSAMEQIRERPCRSKGPKPLSGYRVGIPGQVAFAAQWLAYTLPLRTLHRHLEGADVRLWGRVDRYPLHRGGFPPPAARRLPRRTSERLVDWWTGAESNHRRASGYVPRTLTDWPAHLAAYGPTVVGSLKATS